MERDAFLDRVARQLGRRGGAAVTPGAYPRGVPQFHAEQPLGEDQAQPAERFRVELEKLGGMAVVADSAEAASEQVRRWLDEPGRTGSVSWARTEFAGLPLDWLWAGANCRAWDGDAAAFRAAALAAGTGITTADFAVASTGTLILTTSPSRPRLTSLAPAVHIALVRRDRIVARMGEALDALRRGDSGKPPSGVFFITGPSRTADIENDLSIGVHGPGSVRVVFW